MLFLVSTQLTWAVLFNPNLGPERNCGLKEALRSIQALARTPSPQIHYTPDSLDHAESKQAIQGAFHAFDAMVDGALPSPTTHITLSATEAHISPDLGHLVLNPQGSNGVNQALHERTHQIVGEFWKANYPEFDPYWGGFSPRRDLINEYQEAEQYHETLQSMNAPESMLEEVAAKMRDLHTRLIPTEIFLRNRMHNHMLSELIADLGPILYQGDGRVIANARENGSYGRITRDLSGQGHPDKIRSFDVHGYLYPAGRYFWQRYGLNQTYDDAHRGVWLKKWAILAGDLHQQALDEGITPKTLDHQRLNTQLIERIDGVDWSP